MTINIVYKAIAPNTPFVEDICELQVSFVPQLEGGIWLKSQKYWWATPDDWRVGRKALYEQGIAYLMPGVAEIANAVDRLYTLMAASIQGNTFADAGIDPDTGRQLYDPILPAAADPENFAAPGMQHGSRIIEWGMLNLIQGDLNGPYGDSDQVKALLRAIRDNAAGGTDLTEVLSDLAFLIELLG